MLPSFRSASSKATFLLKQMFINVSCTVEPGIFSLENPSFVIKESIGKAFFKVERTQGSDGKVEVRWKTMDQTAVNGKDYHGGSGTLIFEHGEQVKYISIDIIDDKDFEKDETFIVELTGTSEGAYLGNVKSAAVTIVNDDGKIVLFNDGTPFRNIWELKILQLRQQQQRRKTMISLVKIALIIVLHMQHGF